jgi:MFS family permease
MVPPPSPGRVAWRQRRGHGLYLDQVTAVPKPRLLTPPFALLAVSTLCYFAAEAMLIPALPRLARAEGAPELAGAVIGATSITALLARPWAGRLAGRGHDRRLLLLGCLGYLAVGAGLLISTAPLVLVGLRGLMGLALAVYYAGAGTTLTAVAPAGRRGEAFSYWSTSIYLSLGLGPVLSEWLRTTSGFRSVTVAELVFAGLATLCALGVPALPAPPGMPSRVPRTRLLHRAALFPSACLILGAVGWGTGATFVPLRSDQLGLSGAGSYFAAFGLAVVGVRMLSARVSDRWGRAAVIVPGLALDAAGMALLIVAGSQAGLALGGAVYGLGYGLVFPGLMAYLTDQVPAADRGPAQATYAMALDAAIGAGPLLLAPFAGELGYPAMFALAALAATAGLALFVGGARRQGTLRLGPPVPRA